MTPIKFVSPWCGKPTYLIQLTETVFGTVVEGQQPAEALKHLSRKEAVEWLRDNGSEPA